MWTIGPRGSCFLSGPIRLKHSSHYCVSLYIQMAAYAIPRVMRETVFTGVLYNFNLASTVSRWISFCYMPSVHWLSSPVVIHNNPLRAECMYEMQIGCNPKRSSWLSADTLRLLLFFVRTWATRAGQPQPPSYRTYSCYQTCCWLNLSSVFCSIIKYYSNLTFVLAVTSPELITWNMHIFRLLIHVYEGKKWDFDHD